MEVQIKGLEKVMGRLAPALVAKPWRNFYERTTITVQSKAREKTPVDVGTLRNRLMTEVDRAQVPQWGKVGWLNAAPSTSIWFQARGMEYGTGRMGDPEVSHEHGHFPPGQALDLWARRHGFQSGWQVAAIIAKRGGLMPRRMLRNGLKESLSAIQGFVNKIGEEIKTAWDK